MKSTREPFSINAFEFYFFLDVNGNFIKSNRIDKNCGKYIVVSIMDYLQSKQ